MGEHIVSTRERVELCRKVAFAPLRSTSRRTTWRGSDLDTLLPNFVMNFRICGSGPAASSRSKRALRAAFMARLRVCAWPQRVLPNQPFQFLCSAVADDDEFVSVSGEPRSLTVAHKRATPELRTGAVAQPCLCRLKYPVQVW